MLKHAGREGRDDRGTVSAWSCQINEKKTRGTLAKTDNRVHQAEGLLQFGRRPTSSKHQIGVMGRWGCCLWSLVLHCCCHVFKGTTTSSTTTTSSSTMSTCCIKNRPEVPVHILCTLQVFKSRNGTTEFYLAAFWWPMSWETKQPFILENSCWQIAEQSETERQDCWQRSVSLQTSTLQRKQTLNDSHYWTAMS